MRTAPPSWPAEGVTALGIVALTLLELLIWNLAPPPDRLLIGAVLTAVAVAAGAVYAAVRHEHRHRDLAQRLVVLLDDSPGEQWFTDDTLDGFPAQAVRPFLEGPRPPDLNLLYTAWVFAEHGYGTAWIAHHLDLPTTVVQPLVDAVSAHRRCGRHTRDAESADATSSDRRHHSADEIQQ
ncbi:MAG: hypothetical protein JO362_17230 [Streptomycetaceae bacterium]|nr:hypothetical protein [Streptomycetaceae bacterium]